MIPELQSHAKHPYSLLPPGLHTATLREVKKAFVDDFPNSQMRRSIFSGFLNLLTDIVNARLVGYYILNGSYVTGNPAPKDMDTVAVIDAVSLDRLNPFNQAIIAALIDGQEATKNQFKCDTYCVVVYPQNDPKYKLTVKQLDYWLGWFGKTNKKKTGVEVPKGIIRLDIPSSIDAISEIKMQSTEKPKEQEPEIDYDAETLQDAIDAQTNMLQEWLSLNDNSFSARLQIASIRKHIRWLKTQLSAVLLVESAYDAEVVFDGESVKNHEIDAKLLGKALVWIQDLVTDLTIGKAPYQLRATTNPGSFRVRFRLVDEPDVNETPVLPGLDEPKQEISSAVSGLSRITSLLDSVDNRADIINVLQSPQTQRDFASLMRSISHEKVDFQFRTRQNPIGVTITPLQAAEVSEWLKNRTESRKTIRVTGALTAASLTRNTFEITESRIEFGKEIQNVYRGTIKEKEVAEQLRSIRLGATVNTVIEEIVKLHIELDESRSRYSLLYIENTNVLRLPL